MWPCVLWVSFLPVEGKMPCFPAASTSTLKLPLEFILFSNRQQQSFPSYSQSQFEKLNNKKNRNGNNFSFCCCYSPPSTPTTTTPAPALTTTAPIIKKRNRYRKEYPGESKGIVEEMRFVAMKLRNSNNSTSSDCEGGENEESGVETWQPSLEGFLKYLVDSKLVFDTLDRIVDESDHVAYAYFRRTGLERSESLSKDLEWFAQQDIVIPQPSPPGISYVEYLSEIAEKSAPSFLCHFYNIYFSHIAGGQLIVRQVSEKLLLGRELEFCKWDGDVQQLLKDTRENLNKLGEHWSRDEKNRCLREAAKSFKFSGQIIRLIIS